MKIIIKSSLFSVVTFCLLSTDVNAQSSTASNILTGTAPNATQYLGSATGNAFDLIFKTNGLERMRMLSSNGNIGIGITNPQEKLQIGNNFTFHSGGHGVIGFQYLPSTSIDLDNSKYAAELRFDPTLGNLSLGNSSSLTGIPTSRLFIDKNGNIGIAKTNPFYKLDVAGTIYADQGDILCSNNRPEGGAISIYNHTKNGTAMRTYVQYNMTGGYGNKYSIWSYSADGLTNSERYSIWDNGDFSFHNSASSQIVKFANSGNVGIGTSTPLEKLQLGALVTFHDGGVKMFGYNRYYDVATAQEKRITAGNVAAFGFSATGDVFFKSAATGTAGSIATLTDRMIVLNNGNVLINKTAQTNAIYKLDVNGSVRANEVVVNTTGADFVFEDTYQLMPLKTLEANIKQNKHLPGIASAAEMQENGVGLAELNKQLLQKVEELTLYIIEQNKRIDALENK